MSHLAGFLEPLGLLWMALLLLSLWLWRRGVKREAVAMLLCWLFYSLCACTTLGHSLVFAMERPWVRWEWESVPRADVLLCLGGGISPSEGEITGVDLHQASDRVSTAVELVRRGKAGVLVISGGAKVPNMALSESQTTFQWIQRWALVQVPMMPLGECQNTHDEALKMAELMKVNGWRSVLLVTSASHMRRAKATFEKAGVQVTPVACAYLSDADEMKPVKRYFHKPSADELNNFRDWLHEQLGYYYYWLRGWV